MRLVLRAIVINTAVVFVGFFFAFFFYGFNFFLAGVLHLQNGERTFLLGEGKKIALQSMSFDYSILTVFFFAAGERKACSRCKAKKERCLDLGF